jgi:two-component system response regulator HydG
MQEHANILVASADEQLAQSVGATLQDAGHACTVATDRSSALDEAQSGRYDLVVTGLAADADDGMAVLRAAREGNPGCQVVVIAAESRPEDAVAAMAEGALYYLQAPVNPVELVMFVDRAAEYVRLVRDRAAMQEELEGRYSFETIIGNSRPMQKVFRRMRQIAHTDVTVLLQGETGTGKELVARAIHYNSERRHNRFVPLNCAGLVETILESELFGHEKGAFTGATTSRVGLFEYANHGTLFLDEIGDMPPASQTKLLRVLEHGELVRVGSNEPIHVDVRLVAATHQHLKDLIEEGRFRRDLFYRLNVVTINLPPLRERQGDIPLLTDAFVREFAESYGKTVQGLSPEVRKALFRYSWPGNVRELRNCIEHMVVATTDEVLGEDDLPEYMLEQVGAPAAEGLLSSMAGQPLEQVEKAHIARTLELVDGNRERAAELLGIGERTLYRKIEKYDLR